MTAREERRKHPRARPPGMHAVFEDAFGQRGEGEVLDVGAGGMFVRCDRPPPEGKRLALELTIQGENARLPAIGRVIWVRAEGGAEAATGMGVRFVDVDAAVLSRIEQLIAESAPAPAAPIIAVAPTRERTVLGVGAPDPAPERPLAIEPDEPPAAERSVPIELVTTKPKIEEPLPSEASLAEAGLPRRRPRMAPAVFLVLVAAACGAYVFRARLPFVRTLVDRVSGEMATSQPVSTAPPMAASIAPLASAPATAPSASAPATAPSASAPSTAAPGTAPSASARPTASVSSAPIPSTPTASAKPAKRPPPRAPSPRGATSSSPGDNPY